jgi:hypothetical protein
MNDFPPSSFQTSIEQSVAIFSSREDLPTLLRTIQATRRAVLCERAYIDVVINGNLALAEELQSSLNLYEPAQERSQDRLLRIWYVAMGDKAHAWNEYVRRIWPKSHLAFFVDGYARPHEDALQAISKGLSNNPIALGATAVPTHGMSARSQRRLLKQEGGIQGNLYAVRGKVLQQLIDSGFGLPKGIYRTDPLLAAVICFNLDPLNNPWDPQMMHIEWSATWDYDPLKWWRLRDLLTHFRRIKRQQQGVIENAAVKQWLAIEKRPPGMLPETVTELVRDWGKRCPIESRKLLSQKRSYQAIYDCLLTTMDWSAASTLPTILYQHAF